jgi:hypothetical protein
VFVGATRSEPRQALKCSNFLPLMSTAQRVFENKMAAKLWATPVMAKLRTVLAPEDSQKYICMYVHMYVCETGARAAESNCFYRGLVDRASMTQNNNM